jgi:hypothetical protein
VPYHTNEHYDTSEEAGLVLIAKLLLLACALTACMIVPLC